MKYFIPLISFRYFYIYIYIHSVLYRIFSTLFNTVRKIYFDVVIEDRIIDGMIKIIRRRTCNARYRDAKGFKLYSRDDSIHHIGLNDMCVNGRGERR